MIISEHDKIRFNVRYKVNFTNGCWEWNGTFRGLYGRLNIGQQRNVAAHRISYNLFKGEIPTGLNVLHACDNPKCVNPEHLFLGTNKDNVDDRQKKGRTAILHGDKNPNAKISDKKAYEIKYDISQGLKKSIVIEKHGISIGIYQGIKYNKNWKHVVPLPQQEGEQC